MLHPTKYIFPIILIILSVIIGCGRSEHVETLIIGPYKTTCVGAFEQECYLEFNAESERWEFFL